MAAVNSTACSISQNVLTVLSQCQDAVASHWPGLLAKFFTEVDSYLLHATAEAKSNIVYTDLTDARTILKNNHKQLQPRLLAALMEPWNPTERSVQRPKKQTGAGPDLSLIEPEELEKTLITTAVITRLERRFKEPLFQIEQQFAQLRSGSGESQRCPISPKKLCHAFSRALEELQLNHTQVQPIHYVFGNVLESHLEVLYPEISALLVKNNIHPQLPTGHPSSSRVPPGKRLKAEAVKPAEGSRRASRIEGRNGHYSHEIRRESTRGYHEKPCLDQDMGQAMHTLMELQSLLGDGIQRAYAPAQRRSPSAPRQAAVAEGFHDVGEIVQALGQLPLESRSHSDLGSHTGPGALLPEVMENLSQGGEGKALRQQHGNAIHWLNRLLVHVNQDARLNKQVKGQIQQLEMPLYEAALADQGFFSSSAHPARQVLEQLSELQSGDAGVSPEELDRVLERVTYAPGQAAPFFAALTEELDDLHQARDQRFQANLRQLVQECAAQQAFIQARNKPSGEAARAPPRPHLGEGMPKEWRVWLERVRRLQVGESLILSPDSENPQRLNLAWVGENYNPFVFADAQGVKAASMTLQELAVQLMRGAMRIMEVTETSAVAKAMRSMILESHTELEQQALTDPATGLTNRRRFEGELRRVLETGTASRGAGVVGLLRLGEFQAATEKYNESDKEQVLKRMAVDLQQVLEDRGALARLENDAFGFILEGCLAEEGERLARTMVDALQALHVEELGETFSLAGSVGLVSIEDHFASFGSPEGVFKALEAAGLMAILQADYPVAIYPASTAESAAPEVKFDWRAWLETRLERGDSDIHFQHIVPLWREPHGQDGYYAFLLGSQEGGKFIQPGSVFSAAENAAKAIALDQLVIRDVLHWMRDHPSQWESLAGCLMPLSGPSLRDDGLLDYLLGLLMEISVPPSKVCFELKEIAVIGAMQETERLVRTMKEFGCQFCIAGFGDGGGRYDYLKNLPIDLIKIDTAPPQAPGDYVVLKSLNQVAHLLGKKTIIAHIVTAGMGDELRDIGVDFALSPRTSPPWALSREA
jgi:EAL domain-containing protein (putative c-di-GMP-specific phosphodiesterase class I)/GGDEF domain-containing protein